MQFYYGEQMPLRILDEAKFLEQTRAYGCDSGIGDED